MSIVSHTAAIVCLTTDTVSPVTRDVSHTASIVCLPLVLFRLSPEMFLILLLLFICHWYCFSSIVSYTTGIVYLTTGAICPIMSSVSHTTGIVCLNTDIVSSVTSIVSHTADIISCSDVVCAENTKQHQQRSMW